MSETKVTWKNFATGFNKCQKQNQTYKYASQTARNDDPRLARFEIALAMYTVLTTEGSDAKMSSTEDFDKPEKDKDEFDALKKATKYLRYREHSKSQDAGAAKVGKQMMEVWKPTFIKKETVFAEANIVLIYAIFHDKLQYNSDYSRCVLTNIFSKLLKVTSNADFWSGPIQMSNRDQLDTMRNLLGYAPQDMVNLLKKTYQAIKGGHLSVHYDQNLNQPISFCREFENEIERLKKANGSPKDFNDDQRIKSPMVLADDQGTVESISTKRAEEIFGTSLEPCFLIKGFEFKEGFVLIHVQSRWNVQALLSSQLNFEIELFKPNTNKPGKQNDEKKSQSRGRPTAEKVNKQQVHIDSKRIVKDKNSVKASKEKKASQGQKSSN